MKDDFSIFAITKYINATGRLNTPTVSKGSSVQLKRSRDVMKSIIWLCDILTKCPPSVPYYPAIDVIFK